MNFEIAVHCDDRQTGLVINLYNFKYTKNLGL